MRLALDVGAEQLAEELELGLAGGGVLRDDAVDGAVALDQADDAVGADHGLGEVALLVLDDRELARPVDERGVGRQALGQALAEPVAGQPPALLEDARRRAPRRRSTRIAASRPLASPS